MKVIFLDIDGVLNDIENPPIADSFPFNKIDMTKVSMLNEIIRHTDAAVVISSSWKKKYPFHEMEQILKKLGFEGKVVGETPKLDKSKKITILDRSKEIEAFLEMNDIQNFVIIDDIPKSEISSHLLPNLVEIEDLSGMNASHVKKAIKILNFYH